MIFKIYNPKVVSWYKLLRISILIGLRPCIAIGGNDNHVGSDKSTDRVCDGGHLGGVPQSDMGPPSPIDGHLMEV